MCCASEASFVASTRYILQQMINPSETFFQPITLYNFKTLSSLVTLFYGEPESILEYKSQAEEYTL